jgi:hypothetical protein
LLAVLGGEKMQASAMFLNKPVQKAPGQETRLTIRVIFQGIFAGCVPSSGDFRAFERAVN